MNRNEKIAWFNLAVIIASVVIYAVLFTIFSRMVEPARAARAAISSFALLAAMAFGPMIFKTTNRGELVWIDDQGMVTRNPYRRYLSIAIVYSIILGFIIFLLTYLHITYTRPLAMSLFAFSFITFALLMFLQFRNSKRVSLKNDAETADMLRSGPYMDERDLAIMRKARWIGFGVFWFFFVFGLVGISMWTSPQGGTVTIDLQLAPLILWPSALTIIIGQSIATIILYRRDEIHAES